jgi:hypothetical protein
MSSILIEFVQNYYQCGLPELLQRMEARPDTIASTRSDFLNLYAQQNVGPKIDELPSLTSGELRPIFSQTVADTSRASVITRPDPQRRLSLTNKDEIVFQLKSLLLYAHQIALADPFLPRIGLVGDLRELRLQDEVVVGRPDFLSALGMLCRLEALFDDGVILPFAPPNVGLSSSLDVHESVVDIVEGVLVKSGLLRQTDSTDMYVKAVLVIERIIHQLFYANASDEPTASLILPMRNLDEIIPAMLTAAGKSTDDFSMLVELMRIKLPGVPDVRIADVVRIRDDDSFGRFRVDMRSALRSASPLLDADDIPNAQARVREEMTAAMGRLTFNTRKGVLADAVVADAVGWAAGAAAAAAIADWRAAIATLLGKGITEVFRRRERPSARALRRHYLALSRARTHWAEMGDEKISQDLAQARKAVLKSLSWTNEE